MINRITPDGDSFILENATEVRMELGRNSEGRWFMSYVIRGGVWVDTHDVSNIAAKLAAGVPGRREEGGAA